jgi:hypothetical protein
VTQEGLEDSEADTHGLAICRYEYVAVIRLGRLKEATRTIVADSHGLAICRYVAVIRLGRLKKATRTIVAETGVSAKFQV